MIYVNEKRERYLDHVKNAKNSNDPVFLKNLKHAKEVLIKLLDEKKTKEHIDKKNSIEDTDFNTKSKQLTTFNLSEKVKEEEKVNIKFNSVNKLLLIFLLFVKKKIILRPSKIFCLKNIQNLKRVKFSF